MHSDEIRDIIKKALDEDIKTGDITTDAIVDSHIPASANLLIKEDGIIAGLKIAEEVFRQVDSDLIFIPHKNDSEKVKSGDIAAVIEGSAASILKAERTVLNFLQRMSGIATLAYKFSERVKHTGAKIIDTRKTVPGLRYIDKMAVRISGCENHRAGLYDMFLIKDNHIETAGSITKAVQACKDYQKKKGTSFKIEVETKNLEEVSEALSCNVDVIMLDNFDILEMKKAVEMINGKCKTEASGGVNLDKVKEIAETGVDYISVGALTHSVKALDISLEIKLLKN
jgi:nicotinate-nucleotide pyrophosphorylase (carboxylating)